MDDLESSLARITMAPYIVKAMALIGVRRRSGSNMFRHQIGTLAILLDYKTTDPVLLKASVIHDLFEDAATMPGVTESEITRIDDDGRAVYELVMEVTIRFANGVREPKAEYLLRIMRNGSPRARVLKLADRISNLTTLRISERRGVREAVSRRDSQLHPALRRGHQREHVQRAVGPRRNRRAVAADDCEAGRAGIGACSDRNTRGDRGAGVR